MEIFLKREKISSPTATFSFSENESQNFFAYCARLFEAARVAALQPEEFEEYIGTMVTERDIKNYISYAHEKGKAEGILQTAKIMKSKGVPKETIMEYTGLSAEEVEGL